MDIAYAPLQVNEGKKDANPAFPYQTFIIALQKSLYLSFQKENLWGTSSDVKVSILSPFGQVSAAPNGNCRPGASKGKECVGFWGHPHPSQVTGMTGKKSRILSWIWIKPCLDSACLEAALVLTLLRPDGWTFKYKTCEKWQIRVGQISHLLRDKDRVFARRTPKINLILQIIH